MKKNKKKIKEWGRHKKKLRNRRRANKRNYPENSYIIVDTHIWYLLGKNDNIFHKYRNKRLVPTFSNLYELRNTRNLVTSRKENVMRACQRIVKFKKQINLIPPYICIAKLANNFSFDAKKELASYVEFVEQIANGGTVAKCKEEQFRDQHKRREDHRQRGIDFLNKCIKTVQKKVTDKKAYRNKNTLCDTLGVINTFVEQSTMEKYNIKEIDPSQIELLIKTLDQYFKAAVTGEDRLLNLNDGIDIEIMGYVRPGDKFWTNEKRWIKYIQRGECGHYLFKTKSGRRKQK